MEPSSEELSLLEMEWLQIHEDFWTIIQMVENSALHKPQISWDLVHILILTTCCLKCDFCFIPSFYLDIFSNNIAWLLYQYSQPTRHASMVSELFFKVMKAAKRKNLSKKHNWNRKFQERIGISNLSRVASWSPLLIHLLFCAIQIADGEMIWQCKTSIEYG